MRNWFSSATLKLFLITCTMYVACMCLAHAKIDSQADLLSKIETIYDTGSVDPIKDLTTVLEYVEIAKKQDWNRAYLSAATLQMELLHKTEDIEAVEKQIYPLIELAKSQNQNKLLLRLETAELFVQETLNTKDDIEVSCQKVLEKAMLLEDSVLAANIFLDVGIVQYNNGFYSDAIKTLKMSYDRANLSGFIKNESKLFSALGNVNGDLGNIQTAIKHLERAIKSAKAEEDNFQVSIILYNLGNVYFKDQQYKKAQTYILQALAVSEKLKDTAGIAWAKNLLGDIHVEFKEWQLAIDYYADAAPVFAEKGNVEKQIETLLSQAYCLLQLKQFDQSYAKLVESKPLVQQIDEYHISMSYNDSLLWLEHARGNYETAFNLLLENYDLSFDMFNDEKRMEVEKYRVEFDAEIKDKENQALAIENELKTTKIKQQETQRLVWLLVTLMVVTLLCLAIFLLYIQTRNRNYFKSIALIDDLTKAPNRRAILEQLDQRFSESKRTGKPLFVGLLDLDHFKDVNDKHGHKVGDEVLKIFSDVCKSSLREYDTFGRYGGEEWLIIFAELEPSTISNIFDRISSNMQVLIAERLPLVKEVTFSMGVACFDEARDKHADSIVNRADKRLYMAKSQGRNRYIDYD